MEDILIPFMLFIIYEILVAFSRISWFNYQNPYNFMKYYNDSDEDKNTHLSYIEDSIKSLKKTFFNDAIGNIFNRDLQDSDETNHIATTIITIISTLLFFVLLICGIKFGPSMPLISNYSWIFSLCFLFFIVKGLFAFIYMLSEWILFFLDRVNIKNELAVDGSNIELSPIDYFKALSTSNDEIAGKAFEQAIENFQMQYNTNNVFNIHPIDPIKRIFWFLSTQNNATRYIIYFLMFSYIFSYTIKYTSQSLTINEKDKNEENEENEQSTFLLKKEQLMFFQMFGKLLFNSIFLVLLIFFQVSFFFIINFLFKLLFKKICNKILEDADSKMKKELIIIFSLVGFDKYPDLDVNKSIQKITSFKFYEYFQSFLNNCLIPITLSIVLGFVVTMVFVCWYESKPTRYLDESFNKPDPAPNRFLRYVTCFKASSIGLAALIGLMNIIEVPDLNFTIFISIIVLFLCICVEYILFY